MVLTINSTDLDSYAMIHDDFGTHAGNTQHLFERIRKAFQYMYIQYKPLEEWADQVGANKDTMPKEGLYDINLILKADYFFG